MMGKGFSQNRSRELKVVVEREKRESQHRVQKDRQPQQPSSHQDRIIQRATRILRDSVMQR